MSTSYPYCEARGVIVQTKAGPRASLSGLWATMTPEEFGVWFKQADQHPPMDDFGAHPEGIEAFLSRFPMPERVQRNLFA